MSRQAASARCYIEEYTNDQGSQSVRLREKGTSRKVGLGLADDAARRHFL